MSSKGSPGINRLGNVLQRRMIQNKSTDLIIDFGVIQEDGSLLADNFQIPIPKTDYMVCKGVSLLLTTGDRVIIAWVQSDAIVLDIIQPAASVGG